MGKIRLYNSPETAWIFFSFNAKAFLTSQTECPSHYYTPAIIFIIKHATFRIQRCRTPALPFTFVASTSFERTDHSEIRKTTLRKTAATLFCCHFQRNVCHGRTRTTTQFSTSRSKDLASRTCGTWTNPEDGTARCTQPGHLKLISSDFYKTNRKGQ